MDNNNNIKEGSPVSTTEPEISQKLTPNFARTSAYYKTYNLPRRFDYPRKYIRNRIFWLVRVCFIG